MLWSFILLRANHQENSFPFNGNDITIKAGEFISSHDSLRIGLNKCLSIKQIRTALEYLKATGRVAVKTNNKFSIISVLNWDEYQAEGSQEGKPRAGQGQAKGKPRATNKNEENEKNEKNEKKEENTLTLFGKFLSMEGVQMEKLINDFTHPLVQQELPAADEWLQLTETPSARKYRKPNYNHYLFFKSWLSKSSLRNLFIRKDAVHPSGYSESFVKNCELIKRIEEEERLKNEQIRNG